LQRAIRTPDYATELDLVRMGMDINNNEINMLKSKELMNNLKKAITEFN